MTEPFPEPFVTELLAKLRGERVCYYPVRHHSPACAAHLRRWILTHRPASVLVEGPASFTVYIDALIDERCTCPVALYTTFIDKRRRLSAADAQADEENAEPGFGPPRFAAYYPFCDYSPELVALRTGRTVGARLRFIDLEYAEMVLARLSQPQKEREPVRIDSLAADEHLRHSEYIRSLAQRMGCRDFNELWDHLFESGWGSIETEVFMDRLAAYCMMARLEYTPERLAADGTTAREACMAAAIRDELSRNEAEKRSGMVLVVTGGFHTVALPDLVAQETARPRPLTLGEEEVGTWLMRYSFDQLDALSGYASGMPSPAYYDRLWQKGDANLFSVAAEVIIEIRHLARARNLPTTISTPDAIAAVEMTQALASLRGHPWPLREDVLDGIRSCFVKGEMGTEGQLLMRLVRQVLAGDRVGQVPPGTAVPPIVSDFQQEARRLRLPIDSVERREMVLDLYRNANHRQISRLFHRLDLLGAPFAAFLSGPDFVQGHGLDRMQEHWQVCWSPATESALIEASIYGPTIEDAAAGKLRQEIAKLEDEGQGRNSAAAVALLIRACRLGLHTQAASIIPLIDVHIAHDPAFDSVVKGLAQLELLAHSREPLEATHLTAVPRLMSVAYLRACRLMEDIAVCPDDSVDAFMAALRTLREVLAGSPQAEADNAPPLDPELFHQGLRRVVDYPADKAQAAIVGAAAGILYGAGIFSEAELVRVTRGYLGGTASDIRKCTGILRGLLATAREAAWQVVELIQAIDDQFAAWDDKTFLGALPELRLAFTDLTPREVSQVADHISQMHPGAKMDELIHMDLDEAEVHFALEITQMVRETLRTDGLQPGGNS